MNDPNKKFIDTYTLLTAEGILNQLQVSLTNKDLTNILNHDDAFLKKIMFPFCEYIVNQQIMDYCENLEDFDNTEIQNITIAYRKYLKQNQIEESSDDPLFGQISTINAYLNSLKSTRQDLAENLKRVANDLKEKLKQHLVGWQQLQADYAAQLTSALIAEGYKLPENFQQKLIENLNYQAFEISEPSKEILQRLGIKDRAPTLIESAIINALS